MSFNRIRALLSLGLCLFMGSVHAQPFALGSAFTYQGSLTDAGNPANGNYDLQFKLFNDSSSGAQVGSTLAFDGIPVTGGLFNATLDFGAPAFNGDKRWLEIGVRPGVDVDPTPYTLLTPRTELTAAPYAVHALSANVASDANTLDGLDSTAFFPRAAAKAAQLPGGLTVPGGSSGQDVITLTIDVPAAGFLWIMGIVNVTPNLSATALIMVDGLNDSQARATVHTGGNANAVLAAQHFTSVPAGPKTLNIRISTVGTGDCVVFRGRLVAAFFPASL